MLIYCMRWRAWQLARNVVHSMDQDSTQHLWRLSVATSRGRVMGLTQQRTCSDSAGLNPSAGSMLAANPKLAQWEEQKRLQKRINSLRGKLEVCLRTQPCPPTLSSSLQSSLSSMIICDQFVDGLRRHTYRCSTDAHCRRGPDVGCCCRSGIGPLRRCSSRRSDRRKSSGLSR